MILSSVKYCHSVPGDCYSGVMLITIAAASCGPGKPLQVIHINVLLRSFNH